MNSPIAIDMPWDEGRNNYTWSGYLCEGDSETYLDLEFNCEVVASAGVVSYGFEVDTAFGSCNHTWSGDDIKFPLEGSCTIAHYGPTCCNAGATMETMTITFTITPCEET